MLRKFLVIFGLVSLFFPATVLSQETTSSLLSTAIPGFHHVKDQIAISGSPGMEGFKVLSREGFDTVIDLRLPEENIQLDQGVVITLGMKYISIPVSRNKGISSNQIENLSSALAEASGPVLVLCASGKRAAALWTAYRLNEGASWETALAEGRSAGMDSFWEDQLRPYCKAC
jgi:uncharacterized protein (TIGR01244 family)